MSVGRIAVVENWDDLHQAACDLVAWLRQYNQKLVVAESCSCGMVAAALGGVQGVSNDFCGSAVTYRAETKQRWLGIESELIERFSTESAQVSSALALAVLEKTPEANLSVAVTGDLGPDVDDDRDGRCYLALAGRQGPSGEVRRVAQMSVQLKSANRRERQLEIAWRVLRFCRSSLPPS